MGSIGKRLVLIGALICAVVFGIMAHVDAQAAPVVSGASAGCDTRSPIRPGTSADLSILVDGIMRSYLLHVPTGYNRSHPSALVLIYHGHGGNVTEFQATSEWSLRSNVSDFLAVYLQGAIGPDGMTGWNTGRTSGPRPDPPTDDLGFTDALITHVEHAFCVNTARIYATGFSNGGGFVAILACERAATFAAVAIMAGDYYPQPEGCHPSRAIPLLEMHGTADTINPYGGSALLDLPPVPAWLADWASRDACSPAPATATARVGVTTFTWSRCARGAVIQHYELQGVEHIWPSGNRASDYVRATATFWSFLATH